MLKVPRRPVFSELLKPSCGSVCGAFGRAGFPVLSPRLSILLPGGREARSPRAQRLRCGWRQRRKLGRSSAAGGRLWTGEQHKVPHGFQLFISDSTGLYHVIIGHLPSVWSLRLCWNKLFQICKYVYT